MKNTTSTPMRRRLLAGVPAAAAALLPATALLSSGLLPAGALAQQRSPEEGFEYRLVKPAVPVEVPGKIEVVEFFWYGCPHCATLESPLKEWLKRLPAEVAFRKVHVNFQVLAHQQLYFTLESLGKAVELGDKVFAAIHADKLELRDKNKIADWVQQQGVDRKQFTDMFDSFSVKTKMRKASSLQDAYKVDGVPAFAVNGKYYTAPSMAGGNAGALRVLDFLIAKERGGK